MKGIEPLRLFIDGISLRFPITMYGWKSWTVKNADRKEKLIQLEYSVWGELYKYTAVPERWTSESQSKLSLKHLWRQNNKTETVLLWAHHEKAGFFGKESNAGKNRRQPKKEKNKYEMDKFHERNHRYAFTGAEQGFWGHDIVDIAHSEGSQKSEPNR